MSKTHQGSNPRQLTPEEEMIQYKYGMENTSIKWGKMLGNVKRNTYKNGNTKILKKKKKKNQKRRKK
jgi:hypothetical protein